MQLLLAVVCGVGLILASSSGFTTWLLAGLVLVTLPYVKSKVMRLHRPGSLFTLVALILLGLVLVEIATAYVGSRVDIQENSSWSARLASIGWSLAYLGTSPSTFLFGIGPGQSYLILQSPGSSNLLATSTGEPVTAVWSVVMSYVLEAGLLGALAWTLVLIMVSRAIIRSSARLVGLSCFMAWLAGVIFTTSYLALLPIWLFLGVLLVWDRIFPVRATVNGPGRKPGTLPVPKAVKT